MKKKLAFIATLIISFGLPATAQNTVKRPVAGFSKLSVFGDIAVYLTKSHVESLEIDIPDDVAPSQITTAIESNELTIKTTYGLLQNKKKIKVYLSYKELNSLSAGGSSSIDLPDSVLKTDRLVLNAYTGGTIDLTVDVKYIVAEVSEKAVISIDGFCNNEEVNVALGGVYLAYELESEDATVKASSNGVAKINSSMSLNGSATTGGWIGYMGNPKYKFFTPKLGGKIEKIDNDEK